MIGVLLDMEAYMGMSLVEALRESIFLHRHLTSMR